MLSVNIDSVQVDRKLGEIARDLGFTMRDMVVEQSRLAAQGCIQSTPPINKAMKISQKAGRGAITRDMGRLFTSLEYYTNAGATAWTDLQTKDIAIKFPNGAFMRIPFVRFATNTNHMAAFHATHRSKSSGRAFKLQDKNKMLVQNDRLLNKHKRDVFRRMGQYAAGWLPALEHFASLSKISQGMKVPLFVKKAISRSGRFSDSSRNMIQPEAIITNKLRFGYPQKLEQLIEHVSRERQADAVKWMRVRLRKLIEQRGMA